MNLDKVKRRMIFIVMLGFFVGVMYTNVIAENYKTVTNVFCENYLNKFTKLNALDLEYTAYIIKCRLGVLGGMAILSATRLKKIAGVLFLIWTGFSGGVLAVTAVLSVGIAGMLVFVLALFPHFIFYAFLYMIISMYCLGAPEVRWNKWKTFAVIIMAISGIAAESYLNPWIMNLIVEQLIC